ncbi:MAG TPA: hypothetical protein VD735_04380, partial [Candidatus Saccharimonadales bacterium]|nr:hypothetical protein [Candidatus Saccharimonadales bacterium]
MIEALPHAMGHELDKPREACGVVGVLALDSQAPVGNMLYRGLMAVQHRGEDAAGVALENTNGEPGDFVRERGFGTVDKAVEAGGTSLDLRSPNATCGVGHTRWST